MHKKKIVSAGKALSKEGKVLIMLHGRGADAADILSIASYLDVQDFTLLAPEATNNTWYPYSFLAPPAQNEPWLSSALQLIQEVVDDVIAQGIPASNIYFLGFSQGACLTLEFVTRHAQRYGGVAAFTGGLIGNTVDTRNYRGNFDNTPIFIGTSNPDPHVPVQRVRETETVLQNMGASITVKVYEGMGHTINEDELLQAKKILA